MDIKTFVQLFPNMIGPFEVTQDPGQPELSAEVREQFNKKIKELQDSAYKIFMIINNGNDIDRLKGAYEGSKDNLYPNDKIINEFFERYNSLNTLAKNNKDKISAKFLLDLETGYGKAQNNLIVVAANLEEYDKERDSAIKDKISTAYNTKLNDLDSMHEFFFDFAKNTTNVFKHLNDDGKLTKQEVEDIKLTRMYPLVTLLNSITKFKNLITNLSDKESFSPEQVNELKQTGKNIVEAFDVCCTEKYYFSLAKTMSTSNLTRGLNENKELSHAARKVINEHGKFNYLTNFLKDFSDSLPKREVLNYENKPVDKQNLISYDITTEEIQAERNEFNDCIKELKAAKSPFKNSKEYEDIIKAVEAISNNKKIKGSDNLSEKDAYAQSLYKLNKLMDKYYDHKAKDGINKNAYNKLLALEKVSKIISSRFEKMGTSYINADGDAFQASNIRVDYFDKSYGINEVSSNGYIYSQNNFYKICKSAFEQQKNDERVNYEDIIDVEKGMGKIMLKALDNKASDDKLHKFNAMRSDFRTNVAKYNKYLNQDNPTKVQEDAVLDNNGLQF